MKDEIKEIKVNKSNKSITFINNGIAYSQFGIADEILDLINNLQEENERLKERVQIGQNAFLSLNSKIDKAIEILKLCNSKCAKETINILQGSDKDE